MQAFTFYTPTKILFGKGMEEKVPEEIKRCKGSRVFVVYGGGSVVRSGLLAKVEVLLQKAGLESMSFGGVQPNPILSHVREGVQKAKRFQADFILAVGGGSVIDSSKAIAHGLANPEVDVWKYWAGEAKVEKSTPVGVILTISAAGSEMSDSAVLTNDETSSKRGINTEFNRPRFAIMNPELTYTLPKFQIACGVTDIMMHTLERYFSQVTGNQITDEIAEGLLRVTIANGRKALEDSRDYDAMSEIMWCGSLSHNDLTGLGGQKDFATHQLGHAISSVYDTAHGASLSAVWGSWASYVLDAKPERFAQYGKKVWGIDQRDDVSTGQAAIDATVSYFASLDMPTALGALEHGLLTEDELVNLTDVCMFRGGRKSIGAFKKLERGDVYEIYRRANR